MNDSNLVSFKDMSASRQRAIASKGGKTSQENARKRKQMREYLQAALDTVIKGCDGEPLTSPDDGEPLTREVAGMIKLASQYADGDPKAIELSAKILGQLVLKQEVTVDGGLGVTIRTADEASTYIYNDYSTTYQTFFYQNRNSRHVLLQGGRRSGKTQATLRHLIRLTTAMGGGLKVLVVCYQHPQLLKTIEDFVAVTGVQPHAEQAVINGTTWQFANFDEYTKAQGSQCDFLFINEAVNMPEDIGDVLILGTRVQCYYNFNPTKTSWVTKHVADDKSNLLCTTFKDNAYLPSEQVLEFEQIKERAMRPNSTMHDRYMYEVYYLGNFANLIGAIFTNIEITDEYSQIPAREYYGMDFGFATDGDPTTLVGVKIYNGKIYVRQYIYEQGIVTAEQLVERLTSVGINRQTPLFADYGGQGRGRIQKLISLGFSVYNCHKTGVIDGLSQLLMYDAIVIDSQSNATRREFEGLELDKNQQPRGSDHAIDAVRYAFQEAKRHNM